MNLRRCAKRSFGILFLLSGMCLINYVSTFAYDLKDYFPLGQGNSWRYAVIENGKGYAKTYRVNGKEALSDIETTVVEDSDGAYNCFAVDSHGVKQYKYSKKDRYGIFNPERMIFPVLEIGEDAKYITNLEKYTIDGQKIGPTSVVERILLESATEEIEVPAGKFNDCLKFSVLTNSRDFNGSYATYDCTIWLAPGVGKIKQFCFATEYDEKEDIESSSTEIFELFSGEISGRKIGRFKISILILKS